MEALDQASLRVLRWRVEGLPVRLGQCLLIGGLLWLELRSPLPLVWLAVATATAVTDAHISGRLLEKLQDRRLAALNAVTRVLSAAAFAAVCFVMLIDHSAFGLAAPVLVGCAINLNNAVMSRGSRRFFLSLVGPSSVFLIVLPLAAWLSGHPIGLAATFMLTLGAAAYTVFIAILAAALFKESHALRTALEAAEAASRAKSSFLAVTSHEIRTPLNGVLGMAQAMENDALSPLQRDRIAVIRQSGEALLTLLNDILDLAKIEAGKLDLEIAPFDLEAVVDSAMGAFSARAHEKGLTYGLEFDPAARGLHDGDAARLRQVIWNLVSNAVKFTEAGEVSVSVVATGAGVRLSVSDSGPGVAPDSVERLFDKFTQGDSTTTRKFGGAGLGLSICREIVEAMGGAITVLGRPHGGSTFTVDLPLARSASAAPIAPTQVAAAPVAPAEAALRVLAAEDNPVNQLVLRTLLTQIGIEATIVDTGAEALEAWEVGDYDLVLMDIQMPQKDGPTAARAIRGREAETGRARTPIVALTANVMKHQLDAYAEAGMDGVVAKPIAVAELYAAIAEHLAARTAADDASAAYSASR
jgi:signal transduction histidine kinase